MCVWQAYNVGEGVNIEGLGMNKMPLGSKGLGIPILKIPILKLPPATQKNARQRENRMSLSLPILVAALNLLVLPPSRQWKRRLST